ncbi:hypothetical protein GDO81_025345 [Engystomops pustulosus]|uniref:Uncharacterized protein n=1 Tax=Engystomops pustulosus TaxID=76066 RepID=A0AAV6YNX7_ENGPU|nr:hypothetical protein GDO81_025345 [Engystomops pustulosus]
MNLYRNVLQTRCTVHLPVFNSSIPRNFLHLPTQYTLCPSCPSLARRDRSCNSADHEAIIIISKQSPIPASPVTGEREGATGNPTGITPWLRREGEGAEGDRLTPAASLCINPSSPYL